MIRSLIYIIILSILVFIPVNITKKSEKKHFKKAGKSISVKIVQAQPLIKKQEIKKVFKPKSKPKKVIKKKPIKKKIVPKPLPKIEPKEVEHVVKKQEEPQEKLVAQEMKVARSTSVFENYYSQIYEEINRNKFYPKKSRKFRQQDTIPVHIVIDKEGYVVAFRIVKESQYKELNRAVQKMFRKIKKFKKPPKGIEMPLEIDVDINFKLKR